MATLRTGGELAEKCRKVLNSSKMGLNSSKLGLNSSKLGLNSSKMGRAELFKMGLNSSKMSSKMGQNEAE